jgi:hypothetical protein
LMFQDFSIKISPQVPKNVWIRFIIMDLQYEHLVEDNFVFFHKMWHYDWT